MFPYVHSDEGTGRLPTSEKNSSMKAVLSMAISTSSVSSSCVSCFCERQKRAGETHNTRIGSKYGMLARAQELDLQSAFYIHSHLENSEQLWDVANSDVTLSELQP